MPITRAIPEIRAGDVEAVKGFYTSLLGLETSMEVGDFLLFSSPDDPNIQLMVNGDPKDANALPPGFTVDLGDGEAVRKAHDEAAANGVTIVEPLNDKPWGIRRFSVLDPVGTRVTMLAHV